MAKQTREEKAAAARAEAQTKKVAEFKQRVEREREKIVWSEKMAWSGNHVNERAVQSLWTMVREFEQCGSDLRKKLERMAEEVQRGLERLASNRLDALQYSNPMATPGSDIEQLATRRKTVADGIAHLAYATGYYVPQIHDARANEVHERLVAVDVVLVPATTDRFMVVFGEQPLTGLMWNKAETPDTLTFDSEELAWLAAEMFIGTTY